ncbi:hypothetical protein E1A91_A10G233700v1 [Gossypium mustelinum]|uniref:DUF674 domain-containing protein n=1 Tax=Gossypium mustelinum TaxID=34275 RepID=A0A5D2XR18_GOSMU|nr:hypothetical protein E1A91_A10G233700v1 [Gossypium mustelinum]
MSLNLLIDTKGQRVLYAEAGKDFVNFLFNILLLPVGTLLKKEGMVGCLANLYESIENLGDAYIQPKTNKDTLLNPKSSSLAINVPLLPSNIQSSKPQIIPASFVLSDDETDDPETFVNPPNMVSTSSFTANEVGCVKGIVTNTVMDDSTVTPMSTISSITLLRKFNIKQLDALEEKVVNVGTTEGVEILKASLWSETLLTDVFIAQKAKKKRSRLSK